MAAKRNPRSRGSSQERWPADRTEESREGRRAHPRFQFHFTPTGASWLNLIERFFAKITRKRLPRGTFRRVPTPSAAILSYVREHNRNPQLFIWTASASSILRKIKRWKEALETGHKPEPRLPRAGINRSRARRVPSDSRTTPSETRYPTPGTLASSFPEVVPIIPTPATPFHRPGWIYEEKVDGWRVIAYKDGPHVRLIGRRGVDHRARFPELAAAIAALRNEPDSRRCGRRLR